MDVAAGASGFPNRGRITNPKSEVGATQQTDITNFKKAFGDKGLDQVLNQISDPKYAAKQKRVEGVGNPELGKDAFFKLMMAQLKQQDPTNPLKSHEMAAQLAQFSSVEQLSHIKEAIERNGQKDGHDQYQLLNLIGKVVSGDSSKVKRIPGDKDHKIEFKLPAAADTVKIKIKDAMGREVKTYELKDMGAGKNQVVWNGLNNDDKDAPVGDYKAEIVAMTNGNKIRATTQFKGPVDGVQFSKKGPLLIIGGKSMSLSDVQRIEVNKSPGQGAQPMGMGAGGMGLAGMGRMPSGFGGTAAPMGQAVAGLGPKGNGPMPSAQHAAQARMPQSVAAKMSRGASGHAPGQAAFLSPRNPAARAPSAAPTLNPSMNTPMKPQAPYQAQSTVNAGQAAVSRPVVTDVNQKYSQGAAEPRTVLANLDKAEMDRELRTKLNKK